ncbi:MAG: hypothetical protein ACRDNE_06890 [Gaiellaceae bacterium]
MDALEAGSVRRIQLVSLAQAEEAPLLLADVLADGRVLVDRDGDWPRLERRRLWIARRARAEDERLSELAWAAPEALDNAYPDVRAAGIHEAASALADDLPASLRDYVAWMRRVGFGQ